MSHAPTSPPAPPPPLPTPPDPLSGLAPPLRTALEPVFRIQPLHNAMPALIPALPPSDDPLALAVQQALQNPALQHRPHLHAALLLYADLLDQSHSVSQNLHDPAGSAWHAIMHRREADFDNSLYWWSKAANSPIPLHQARELVNTCRAAASTRTNPPALLQQQRNEWAALFLWSAQIA